MEDFKKLQQEYEWLNAESKANEEFKELYNNVMKMKEAMEIGLSTMREQMGGMEQKVETATETITALKDEHNEMSVLSKFY